MNKSKKRVLCQLKSRKEADLSHIIIFLSMVLFGIFSIVIVEGFDVISVTPVNPGAVVNGTNITGPVTEDVNFTINITVNNTALVAYDNITQVNVTLPSSFSFLNGTNNTNATTAGYGLSFVNTSTVISWNSTLAAGAGATLVSNATLVYFWFMINASTPGSYNITVTTMNVSGFTNTTNISITVNDTTIPSNITFQGATPANGTFLAGNETNNASIFINLSAYDNGAIQSFLTRLSIRINSTNVTLNQTNLTTISNFSQERRLNDNFTLNFTNLADGVYFINVTTNDTFNNVNSTFFVADTRTIIVDNLFPNVSYSITSDGNGSFLARNWTLINLTIVDANPNATNISIHNSTGWVFQSNVTQSNGSIIFNITNFSGLRDGVYFVNVTANDSAGHRNLSLPTRTFIIDTIVPVPSYGVTSDGNGSFVGRNFVYINISVTDANINFTNITLNNASGHFIRNGTHNLTLSTTLNYDTFNFTSLSDGVYFVNVTVNDSAGWSNGTLFHRTVTVDTTNPNISYVGGTDANNSYVARNFIIVEVNSTDTNFNMTNITIFNATSSAIVRSNQTFNVSDFGSNRTNVALYINFTGLADGTYFFNVTGNDSAGNSNKTLQTRTITVDTAAPALTLTEGTITSSSINVSITANDATSGVNGTCTTDRSGASVSGTGATQQLYESSLTCSTAYTYIVTCRDRAANSISASITSTTLGCDVGAGAGGAGGGGGSGTGEKWSNTIVVKSEQLDKGYSRELKERERVSVIINNANHHVGIVSIDNTAKKATIEVASTPQKITLELGESKKVEVTNDSYYDLQVTLRSIMNGKADVLIKKIKELIVPSAQEPQVQQPSGEEQQQSSAGGGEPTSEEPTSSEERSKSILAAVISALALAVIIVVVLIVIVHRKGFR